MTKLRRFLGVAVSVIALLLPASVALAGMPQLSLSQDNSNMVRLNVTGADPYAQVNLYQRQQGSDLWTIVTNFGTTDGSGYFSGVAGLSTNGTQSEYYVVVNGYQSTIQRTNGYNNCYSSCYNNGSVTVSQSSVTVNQGQSAYVALYGGNSSYYISTNSNSYAVDASITNSSLYVYGKNTGNSTITVCSYNYSGCASVYVSVGGGSYYGSISFSETSPTVTAGQTKTISIYNSYYTGYFYVSVNSNNTVVDATISGSNLMLYGKQNGSSTVTVCQSNNGCGNVYVTVSGYNQYYNNQYPYYGGNVYGATYFRNGSLISENGTVYIVYKNTKTGFANKQAFEGLGYKWGNVANVGSSGLTQSSYTVTSQYMAHPWGTWIKWGNTVYFVHENGLIPVPTYDTFTNNGGTDAYVVPANIYDTTLPILQNMTYQDSRLR